MKYCDICGEQIPNNNSFCNNCGASKSIEETIKKEEKKYCFKCGNDINEAAAFCKKCGYKTDDGSKENIEINDDIKLGWSDKINDPSFKKFRKNSMIYKFIFGLILTLLAYFGFTIFGPKNGMGEKEALLVGVVISGMFALITIFSMFGSKGAKDWEGTVIDKTITKKRKKVYSGSSYRYEEFEEYVVLARDNLTGKIKKISKEKDSSHKYDYWNVGDRFRYYGRGIHNYEKYDKRKDKISFCFACGYLNDIKNNNCENCNCPILK